MLKLISLLGSVPALLGQLFGTVNHITDAISNEKIAVVNATTEQERIVAQERVNTLTLRRDLMIAEAAVSKLNIYIRAGLALGPLVILLKVFVWDKSIGPFVGCVGKLQGEAAAACHMFNTDALDPNLWNVVSIVLGFYFLAETATSVTRMIKTKVGGR